MPLWLDTHASRPAGESPAWHWPSTAAPSRRDLRLLYCLSSGARSSSSTAAARASVDGGCARCGCGPPATQPARPGYTVSIGQYYVLQKLWNLYWRRRAGGSWGLIFGAKRSRGHDGSAPCDLNPEPPALRGCAWSRPRATAPRRRLVSVAAAYFGANAPRDQAFLAPRNSRQAVEAGRRARRRGVKERDCGVVGILVLQCSAFPGGETGEQDHATTGRWPRHGGVVHADRDIGIHTPDLSYSY